MCVFVPLVLSPVYIVSAHYTLRWHRQSSALNSLRFRTDFAELFISKHARTNNTEALHHFPRVGGQFPKELYDTACTTSYVCSRYACCSGCRL